MLENIIKKEYDKAIRVTNGFLKNKKGNDFLVHFIDLPMHLINHQFDFWRMQYKILPLNPVAQQYHTNFMRPSKRDLIETFDALGYSEPEIETEIVLLLIDNLWKGFVSEKLSGETCEKITMLLKKKYEL